MESTAQERVCCFCQTALSAEESKTACPECKAEYHTECWEENGGCSVYGCSQVPKIEQRRAIEIPVSHWGQENKPCPVCGREILAAAVRCRHCGATFSSAAPQDAEAFNRRATLEKRLPTLRHTVPWIFVCSVLPCLAPIGGVWGLIWYANNKQDLKALPPLYPALCKIGIAVGLGQTVLMVLMAILYTVRAH